MNEGVVPNCASVLTPGGRGAVAVVAATGPAAIVAVDTCFRAANGRPMSTQAIDRIAFGHWHSGPHREEVIVLRGPENSVEIHCHGGVAATQRITSALADAGCEIIPWREWLDRGAPCLLTAEADAALAQATTHRAAAILLDQRSGALRREIEAIQRAISGNDLEAAGDRLRVLLSRAEIGTHLTEPWCVAIGGKPNVGKSSLINALVGYQRAIVFDRPGTTRDVLTAETAIDGWPVRFADAAGLRDSDDPLEAEGVSRARSTLEASDLVLWVVDGSVIGNVEQARAIAQREFTAALGQAAADRSHRVLFVANKQDLLAEAPSSQEADVIWISALTGHGVDSLLAALGVRLAPAPPAEGAAMPFLPRHVELIEAALRFLDDGQPHAAAEALANITAKC